MKLYQVIARTLGALHRCEQSGNTEWIDRHQAHLDELMAEMPSGSGFDHGTKLSDESTKEKLIFETGFHHMNEDGYYDGWTEHKVIVTASLEMGSAMRITGRDRNQIKEYIGEIFSSVLNSEIEEYAKAAPVQTEVSA